VVCEFGACDGDREGFASGRGQVLSKSASELGVHAVKAAGCRTLLAADY